MVDFALCLESLVLGGFVVLSEEGFCSLSFKGLMMLVGFFDCTLDSGLDCVLAKSFSKSLELSAVFVSFGVGFGADFILDLACF